MYFVGFIIFHKIGQRRILHSMIILFLLFQLLSVNLTFEPDKLTDPLIKSGHINLIIAGNFVNYLNPPYSISANVLTTRYRRAFSNGFSANPSVGLGIYNFQLDPRYYQYNNALLQLKVVSGYQNYFLFDLTVGTQYSFLNVLKIFYFAVDVSLALEIVDLKFIEVRSSYLENYQDGVYQWRYHNQTINFHRRPTPWARVRFIASIAGHKFLQNNYTMIYCTASHLNSTHYQFRLAVHNYTRISEGSSYVIAIDQYVAENYLKYYQYESILTSVNMHDVIINFSPTLSRIFVGYSQFWMRNSSGSSYGIQFFWDTNHTGTLNRYSNGGAVRINVLEPFIWDCPVGYFDPLTKTCLDSCTLYPGAALSRVCNSCVLHCSQCLLPVHCLKCVETRQPDANYYRCICKTLYYQKGEQLCELCSVAIFGCATCSSANNCIKCDVNLEFNPNPLSNTTCVCQDYRQFNSENVCVCLSGYFDNSGTCQKCHYSCVNCNGPSKFNCTQCNIYVYRSLKNGVCQCATDWKFDELCTTLTSDCDPSICYLDPSIDLMFEFDTINIVKDQDNNILIYTIRIQPQLQFLNYIHFNLSIDTGLGLATTSTYKYQSGVLTLYVAYGQSAQGNTTQLIISLVTASKSFSKLLNYSQNYTVAPINNLAANIYSSQEYNLRKVFKYSTYVLVALSFGVFFVGAYSSKVVVSEMMGIVQCSFLGLFLLNFNDPMIDSLAFLKFSNGFNDIIPNQASGLPNRIYLLGYSELIMNNLNIIGIIVILPFFFSFIFLIISKIKRRGKLTVLSYFRLCLGQWTMFVMLFCLYNLSTSTTLFATHVTTRDWRFTFCIVEISIIFLFVFINLLLYGLTDYNYFGQYKCMFKWKKFELNYYYFHALVRIATGVVIGLFNSTYISGIVVSSMLFVLCLITAIKKPYSDNLQSARSSVNFLIGSVIWILYTLVAAKGSTNGNNFYSRTPIIIIALLYTVVFMGLGFTIRQFLMMKKIQISLQQPSDSLQAEKQQHNQLMKKRIQQELQKNEGQNNFAKKLFLSKNKRPRKKKSVVEVPHDFHTETVESKKLMQQIKMDNINVLEDEEKGLSMARVRMVDEMLKQGLL